MSLNAFPSSRDVSGRAEAIQWPEERSNQVVMVSGYCAIEFAFEKRYLPKYIPEQPSVDDEGENARWRD
eukprot:169686-Amphidinium_carterae.1